VCVSQILGSVKNLLSYVGADVNEVRDSLEKAGERREFDRLADLGIGELRKQFCNVRRAIGKIYG